MSAMQAGTQMVKLRGGSKGLARFYFLDEHRSCIRWRPSRKNEKAKSEWGGPAWGSGGQGRAPRPAPRGAEDPPRAATGQLKGQQDLSPGSPRPGPWAQLALEILGDIWTRWGEGPGPAAHLAEPLGLSGD